MFGGCALEEIFMVLRIRTLVEDTVEKPDLIGEHGLGFAGLDRRRA
jgi:hypothetical protein